MVQETSQFTAGGVIRIGAIGCDSSHLPEFTKRINALNQEGNTTCLVTAMFDPGNYRMPETQVAQWKAATRDMGVDEVASIERLLASVDAVMVLSVDGATHANLALPALRLRVPTYVDKPLTCDLAGARRILDTAREFGARCYSASSLRFAGEVGQVRSADLGQRVAIDAFGPGELNDAMPGVFFYGVHTIEMVDALWGPGVARVRASRWDDRDLLDLEYRDGRIARLRLERKGCYDFGATVQGTKAARSFKVDFADVYNRLVAGMTGFFAGGPAPADLRSIVENVAVMEAANRSMLVEGGAWVQVPEVR